MKEYCFDNFFKVYYFKPIPIKYITQNKELDKLKNSCIKNLLINYKNEKYNGVYIALTNDIIIRRLKCIDGMKLLKICIPYKCNINGLKKYLVGENTYCNKCKKKCSLEKYIGLDSPKRKYYFVIFWKHK